MTDSRATWATWVSCWLARRLLKPSASIFQPREPQCQCPPSATAMHDKGMQHATPAAARRLRKVKFVASDPARGGLPVKRKQVQQACAACRRKKVPSSLRPAPIRPASIHPASHLFSFPSIQLPFIHPHPPQQPPSCLLLTTTLVGCVRLAATMHPRRRCSRCSR